MNISAKIGVSCLNILSHLPLTVHYFFSDVLLYPIVHYIARYRLKVVRRNLQNAFPEKDKKERREIECKFYHYFCDLAVEIVKAHSMSAKEMQKRMTFVGIDALEDTFANHDFVCCYLSHYCNWEWAVILPYSLKEAKAGMCQIYHPLKNKVFDQWFLDNRSRFGAINIPMKQTLRKLLALRNEMNKPESNLRSYMFGCIADQLPKAENIHHRIKFLNQDTGVFTGSEVLADKLNMACVYCKFTRPRRGYYKLEFFKMCDNESKETPYPKTEEYMRRFENDVRQQPELWLWTHDRWKR